jgi:DNA-directed RNA polymerase subunit B
LVISENDLLLLQKSFFKQKGLVRQHLDSYNKFIDTGLQEVIDEIGEIKIEIPEMPYKIKLGQLWVIDPQSKISRPYRTEVDGTKHEIFPMEARFRNLTYAAPLALEMTPVIDGRETCAGTSNIN